MSDAITPALTPEEWRDWRRGVPSPRFGDVRRKDSHAVAALLLHGQPFGFSWADVDEILGSAGQLEGEFCISGEPGFVELRNIAARIAALLPPREEHAAP